MCLSRKYLCFITIFITVLLILTVYNAVEGQISNSPYNGKELSPEELQKVLIDHGKWVKEIPFEKLGKILLENGKELSDKRRADLSGAILTNIDMKQDILIGANLCKTKLNNADLRVADLGMANLSSSILNNANLENANLSGANLSNADLENANLKRANLSNANLSGANLSNADLENANLREANLSLAQLKEANLSGVILSNANLKEAIMNGAILSNAKLNGADLYGADLDDANMRNTTLIDANLFGASLKSTKLNEANLIEANLGRSDLSGADLSGAVLYWTNLILEKESAYSLFGVKGLSDIKIINNISVLDNLTTIVNLRNILKESGFKNEERSLTSALRKYQLKGSYFDILIKTIILGGWLTDYGTKPGNLLGILLLLIIIFMIIYFIVLYNSKKKELKVGIWKILPENRVIKEPSEENELILWQNFFKSLLKALQFSFISAFYLGWKDLDIYNWVSRIQKKEYTLKATGWVRTVSGIQSLISLYLIAIFLLTYFGNPFE